MIVRCINNTHYSSNGYVTYKNLTINKVYEVIEIYDFFGVSYYTIIDDNNRHWRYDVKNFILLEEYRNNQIDKLL